MDSVYVPNAAVPLSALVVILIGLFILLIFMFACLHRSNTTFLPHNPFRVLTLVTAIAGFAICLSLFIGSYVRTDENRDAIFEAFSQAGYEIVLPKTSVLFSVAQASFYPGSGYVPLSGSALTTNGDVVPAGTLGYEIKEEGLIRIYDTPASSHE